MMCAFDLGLTAGMEKVALSNEIKSRAYEEAKRRADQLAGDFKTERPDDRNLKKAFSRAKQRKMDTFGSKDYFLAQARARAAGLKPAPRLITRLLTGAGLIALTGGGAYLATRKRE
jgi:hypothetical protein